MSKYGASEGTKQKLVQAAGELWAELGIDGVSTRAVAEAAGENIGSIHYHFGGKDGLFEAVVQDAMSCCTIKNDKTMIDALGDTPTKQELSACVRKLVKREIDDMFRSDRPYWHSLVIYQLLQRDDALFEMFRSEVLNPSMDEMSRFLRLVDPGMSDEDVFLHSTVLKLPIFAHSNYRKAMLKRLGYDDYSEDYLQKLEDLLVRQALLIFELPQRNELEVL